MNTAAAGDLTITPVTADHHDAWMDLYQGYADFYHSPIDAAGKEVVWGWLMDPAYPFEGLVAARDGGLIGLVHFRVMPSPLRATEAGFIDDLFVRPDVRGSGAADRLMEAVYEIGQRRGWPVIRWITHDLNYRARGVYDRIATKTAWTLYEKKFDPSAY